MNLLFIVYEFCILIMVSLFVHSFLLLLFIELHIYIHFNNHTHFEHWSKRQFQRLSLLHIDKNIEAFDSMLCGLRDCTIFENLCVSLNASILVFCIREAEIVKRDSHFVVGNKTNWSYALRGGEGSL